MMNWKVNTRDRIFMPLFRGVKGTKIDDNLWLLWFKPLLQKRLLQNALFT